MRTVVPSRMLSSLTCDCMELQFRLADPFWTSIIMRWTNGRCACLRWCAPRILQSDSAAEIDLTIKQGETVEVKTGFVLLEGSQAEQRLHDGFSLWLEFSGAGGAGIPVGNGLVTVEHYTEYAVEDEECESYHAAARRLIDQKVESLSITTPLSYRRPVHVAA